MALSLEEQEVHITFNRTEDTARVYASDTTFQTYMDRRVKANPEEFKLIKETEDGKMYECPKKYVSMRTKTREVSEEQKQAASERFKKYHAEKNS